MLVFTRKLHQSFTVGNSTITIVALSNGKVSVGVTAPPDVKILRTELQQKEVLEPCKL